MHVAVRCAMQSTVRAAPIDPPRRPSWKARFTSDDVIARRYRVVASIARGGMGEVYAVDDRVLDERVALKVLRPEIGGDARSLERFRREIQITRKITHRNV